MLLHGILPATTTPFYPNGEVYFKKIEANVERYSKTPVAGIVVLGTTGEAILMSGDEQREVLRCARSAASPEKVLVAGAGAESAHTTLKLTEFAAELGYDVALVRTPHYFKGQMTPAALLAFYRFVADRSPIPLMIYNIPQCTGYDLASELVIELAAHPNIIGIKESGGDVEKVRRMAEGTRSVKRSATVTETFAAVTPRMLQAAAEKAKVEAGTLVTIGGGSPQTSSSAVTMVGGLKTRQKEVGFQILIGQAQKLKVSLEAGAVGAILAMADPAPTACYEIYAAWKEGDAGLAALKQERIVKASNRIVGELGIGAVKYAMDLNGYFGGTPRLPLLPITGENKKEIEQVMSDIRN